MSESLLGLYTLVPISRRFNARGVVLLARLREAAFQLLRDALVVVDRGVVDRGPDEVEPALEMPHLLFVGRNVLAQRQETGQSWSVSPPGSCR